MASRRAALACWSLLLTGLFVFYAKLANVDMPLLCWLGFAILGFIRIWTRNDTQSYVLFGVAAAAAMATKDQAYASLAFLPVGVFVATVRSQGTSPLWRRMLRAFVDRRVLLGALASLIAFAVFHNALFNFSGVVEHFKLLSTLHDLASVPRTLRGYADLTVLTGELFRFTLGWPLCVAAVAGVIGSCWRAERRWWLWLLLVPLSFHFTFTFATLWTTDRYLIGGVFVAALFAGSALADLLDRVRPALLGRTAVAVVLGYSLLSAASINAMMARDARVTTRAWVEEQAREGDRVGLIGWYMPALGPSVRPVHLEASRAAVAGTMPEWLVFNGRYATRFDYARYPLGRELMGALRDGSLGYDEVFRHRGSVPWWALLQYDPEFSNSRESLLTNLDKINPEMIVYRRR